MPRLHRAISVVLPALFAACGTPAPSSAPEPATEMIRVANGTSTSAQMSSTMPNTVVLSKPINIVWLSMGGVFDSLGVPLTTVDPNTHTMGNGDLQLRRRLGSTPLREYLNCGTTQGAENTDSYDVRMSVVAKLTSNPDGGTTVSTTVQGMGRPITTSGDYLRCSSTGNLEIRLGDIVRARTR